MDKNKKTLLLIASALIGLAILITIAYNGKNNSSTSIEDPAKIILFYGNGCPHCEIVEEYIKQNGIENKLNFDKKEVFENKSNAQSLTEKAGTCGIPSDQIGVPLLWDGEKCLVGDEDIIKFFKDKTDVQ